MLFLILTCLFFIAWITWLIAFIEIAIEVWTGKYYLSYFSKCLIKTIDFFDKGVIMTIIGSLIFLPLYYVYPLVFVYLLPIKHNLYDFIILSFIVMTTSKISFEHFFERD